MAVQEKSPAVPATQEIGSDAAALIDKGHQLIQIRTDKQLMVATQRPRDEKDIAKRIKEEAVAAGEDFYYAWDQVAKHNEGCPKGKACRCPKDLHIQGAGVGLTRSLMRLWGNCSVEPQIISLAATEARVGAWVVDFETNYSRYEEKIVPLTRGYGNRVWTLKDRERTLAIQKALALAERDASLKVLPKHIVEDALAKAMASEAAGNRPLEDQMDRIRMKLTRFGVTDEMIQKYIGCAFKEDAIRTMKLDPKKVCKRLRAVLSGLDQGETSAQEVFGAPGAVEVEHEEVKETPPASKEEGAIQTEDLSSGLMKKVADGANILGWNDEKLADRLAHHNGDYLALYAEIRREAGAEQAAKVQTSAGQEAPPQQQQEKARAEEPAPLF